VLAEPADEAELAAVGAIPLARVRDGLAQALACGLLGEDGPRGQELIWFRHVLAARAVYEEIPAGPRREMHLRAAQALEAHSPLPVARLTRHFREVGDTGRWRECAEQAADLALAAGDPRTAADLMHELLTSVDLSASIVVSLMHKIPPYAVPKQAFLADFVRVLRRVCDDEAATAAQRAELRFCLGRVLLGVHESEAAANELKLAVPGLAHRPAELAQAMIWLAWPHHLLWPVRVHRRWLERADAVMEANPSIPAADRLELMVLRLVALLRLGDDAAWPAAEELPRHVAAIGGTRQRMARQMRVGYLNMGDAAIRWGRYGEARRWLTAAREQDDARDYPRIRDAIGVDVARLDWCTGAWAGLAERAAALTESDFGQVRLEARLIAGQLGTVAGGPAAGTC
jgi:hypothetical protein